MIVICDNRHVMLGTRVVRAHKGDVQGYVALDVIRQVGAPKAHLLVIGEREEDVAGRNDGFLGKPFENPQEHCDTCFVVYEAA